MEDPLNGVAYDLDGVLFGDIKTDFDGRKLTSPEYEQYHKYPYMPIFEPEGRFHIVTGRPPEDLPNTLYWCRHRLQVQPECVWHDNRDTATPGGSARYKAMILPRIADEYGIHTYVESEERQADYIRKAMTELGVNIQVIWFDAFVKQALRREIMVWRQT